MELSEAITLLEGVQLSGELQRWVDLGCGDGLFTKALASLLPNGSEIIAIDRDETAIDQVPANFKGVSIKAEAVDFTMMPFSPGVDGILMANSLHFIRDAELFLERLIAYLNPAGQLLIIEYDTEEDNQWVPYPISARNLTEIGKNLNLTFTELNRAPSQFGSTLYSASLTSEN